ncbi:putative enzyme [uncultured Alphaproteobacteria bacterium]|uniref:Putative enzyme n=1 Tax=uncultured Alphaproteobacteria bacterium TaxID=91750 RepID=A0A212IX85_9PROT|nr:putative enzyme [uncultured Alphaproteobacteria bacterium]
MSAFAVACLQVNSGEEMSVNVDAALRLAADAADAGADLILMPENVAMMTWGTAAITAAARPPEVHPALAAFRAFAKARQVWLHCGTLAVPSARGKVYNRTYVVDPEGGVAAVYDKLHMFDVDLGGGERYAESATFEAGDRAVAVDLPWGRLGLSVCYDLRFPYLYRALAGAGADFLAVPAAFTQVTGAAHWHVLLRARAIETGCFVFAPAQTGTHVRGRRTYGHSLIVSPWGEVLADGGEGPGFVIADIDPSEVDAARGKVPSLAHGRTLGAVEVGGGVRA